MVKPGAFVVELPSGARIHRATVALKKGKIAVAGKTGAYPVGVMLFDYPELPDNGGLQQRAFLVTHLRGQVPEGSDFLSSFTMFGRTGCLYEIPLAVYREM